MISRGRGRIAAIRARACAALLVVVLATQNVQGAVVPTTTAATAADSARHPSDAAAVPRPIDARSAPRALLLLPLLAASAAGPAFLPVLPQGTGKIQASWDAVARSFAPFHAAGGPGAPADAPAPADAADPANAAPADAAPPDAAPADAAPADAAPADAAPADAAAPALARPAAVQEQALLAIKDAVDPQGQYLLGWDPGTTSYCNWVNVLCDPGGNVIRVSLSYLNLQGSLPPAPALLDLPRLEGLLLGGNSLKGGLPQGYADTTLQEIYLNDNNLTGRLPAKWAEGPLAETLRELSVSFNQLSGELPPEWGALTALRLLRLSSNRFTGSVPPEWAAPASPGMPALQTLALIINPGLTGCLPAALAGPPGPKVLGLSGAPAADAAVAARDTGIKGFCPP